MRCLIDFDVRIDFSHKEIGSNIANGAANDAQCAAEQRHIAKVEGHLEKTVHPAKLI